MNAAAPVIRSLMRRKGSGDAKGHPRLVVNYPAILDLQLRDPPKRASLVSGKHPRRYLESQVVDEHQWHWKPRSNWARRGLHQSKRPEFCAKVPRPRPRIREA